jgi:uncharacterized protein (DUF2267 family)
VKRRSDHERNRTRLDTTLQKTSICKSDKGHRAEFLAAIEDCFGPVTAPDPEDEARAVFRVLARHVCSGEGEDVTHLPPEDLRDLWPAPGI